MTQPGAAMPKMSRFSTPPTTNQPLRLKLWLDRPMVRGFEMIF
jgi:hypothetical protein